MKTISKITYLGLALFVLICFALSPQARAVCQEGCDLIDFNTFLGDDALINNTSIANTAVGSGALSTNTSGSGNTANGYHALNSNTTGGPNTAIGIEALLRNTSGGRNTAIGSGALVNSTGSDNIALGDFSGQNLFTGSHNIYIGNEGGSRGESRHIRVGTIGLHTATFIAGISEATVPDGVGVVVGTNGKLGTVVSSGRFKDAIQPMNKTSEAILSLRPVTFRYKHDLDPKGIPQFGLVAEEVEKVNPDLVARDEQGKPYTVRYEAVNAMLLNEFLKEHRKVETLEATVASLAATVKEQAEQIQKVNAQLEVSKPLLQTVVNNH